MYSEPILNLKDAKIVGGKIILKGEPANGILLVYSEHCPHCVSFEDTYACFTKETGIKCFALGDGDNGDAMDIIDKAVPGGIQFVPHKMIIENGVPKSI